MIERVLAFVRGRLWLWELSGLAWLLLLPYIMTAHGHLDWSGHALGRDFVNYWTAGQLVREGHALVVFGMDSFLAAEHRLFDPALPFHFWSYPPTGLLPVAPLGLLPYVPALILWSIGGLVLLTPAARAFLPQPRDWVLVVLSPAAAINVGLGQNGAITAALLIGGLALWRTRPIIAGALLGLLIFKPQIAILLPIAVIAERRWPTLIAAAGSALAMCLLSLGLFGVQSWIAFFHFTVPLQEAMLSRGTGPFQWMMASTFMTGRLWGLPDVVAMTVQAPVTLWAAWLTWLGCRSDAPWERKAALVMTATFVASPQGFNYDLIPAAAAALVLWRAYEGAIPRSAALAVWALPVFLIAAEAAHIAIAPLVLGGATWLLYRLCVPANPTLAASASTVGEAASNT